MSEGLEGVVELVEDKSQTIVLYPDVLPASATVTLYDSGGTSLGTPTVSVDATDTTINAAPSSPTVFSVASASGMAADRHYWWQSVDSSLHGSRVLVSEIDTNTVTLEAPPAGTTQSGDAIKGLRCTATVTTTMTADRGRNLRLDWIVTDGNSDLHYYRQIVHVVRTKFTDAVAADDVARYVAGLYRNWSGSQIDAGHYRELARRASERVREELRSRERYPDLFGHSRAFRRAGIVALRLELYDEGLLPPGEDASTWLEDTERELERQVDKAVAGMWYDADDSGGFDEATETVRRRSVELIRQ